MRISDLLQEVIDLANDGKPIIGREVRLQSGLPAGSFYPAGQESGETARRLLSMLADPYGTDAFDAAVGGYSVPMTLYTSGNGRSEDPRLRGTDVGCLAPVTCSGVQTVIAILALARATAHRGGGALANRIACCQTCGRFWLLPTLKNSRYCSKRCREKARFRSRTRGSGRADRR